MTSSSAPDHYFELGLTPAATSSEIKTAYRTLALRYHPDNGEEGDVERFKRINAAHSVLSVRMSRARYDQMRRTTAMQARPAGGATMRRRQGTDFRGAAAERARSAQGGSGVGGGGPSPAQEARYRQRVMQSAADRMTGFENPQRKWFLGQKEFTPEQGYFARKYGAPGAEDLALRRQAVRASQGRGIKWLAVPAVLLTGVLWAENTRRMQIGNWHEHAGKSRRR